MKPTFNRVLVILFLLLLCWAAMLQLRYTPSPLPCIILAGADLAVICYCGWTLRCLWRRKA